MKVSKTIVTSNFGVEDNMSAKSEPYRPVAPTLLGKIGLRKMRARAHFRKKSFWKKEKVPKRVKVNFYTRRKRR